LAVVAWCVHPFKISFNVSQYSLTYTIFGRRKNEYPSQEISSDEEDDAFHDAEKTRAGKSKN